MGLKLKDLTKKMKIIILASTIGIVLLLSVGGGIAYYFSSQDDVEQEEEEEEEEVVNLVYLALPSMIIGLNEVPPVFAKVTFVLHVDIKETQLTIEALQVYVPSIQDKIQSYMRVLKKDELIGMEGFYKIKRDMLHRLNLIDWPVHVVDVLLTELLMQ